MYGTQRLVKKLLVNKKLKASPQTNVSPKHEIKRYEQQNMNFETLLG